MKIVKKEIVIDAPAEKVWAHVTEPEKIAGWLMPNDFVPTTGAAFSLQCPHQGKISCVVKEIVPLRRLVYSFRSAATRVETLVTITLTAEGGRTRLTLVHSGWDTLPPEDQDVADQFGGGWAGFMEKLRTAIA